MRCGLHGNVISVEIVIRRAAAAAASHNTTTGTAVPCTCLRDLGRVVVASWLA